MKIIFEEPELLHPNSETVTIFEVAQFLESKYHICAAFTDYIAQDLLIRLAKYSVNNVFESSEKELFVIEAWLQDQWREFILDGKMDIITEAAQRRGDPSFVDTSAYYLNMQIKLKG